MSASPTLDHATGLESGRRSSFRRASGSLYRTLVRALPHNRFGDKLFALVEFIKFHNRLPTRASTYNDVLYRIKASDDILDPLRVFVSDKEFVKLYVKAVVGDEYNVPTIDIIRSAAALDTSVFPAPCVI